MAASKSILFVTSEVTPFIKTGGLADVSAALPLALVELGHDVRIIAPKYGNISERRNRIHEIKRLKDIPIIVSGKETMATVKSSQVVNSKSKVQVYLVTNDDYLEPYKGAYVNPKTGKDFPNNDERFTFFQKAAIETCFRLGWKPDIIHCNDWQTGMIPVFLKELYTESEFFKKTKTIFTIHNLSYQGEFPKSSFDKMGLSEELFSPAGVAHDGKLNMMKAGIVFADAVTTVSPTYAKEILKKENGAGLDSILRKQKSKLHGILNGVDTEIWNPATDKLIDEKFDANSLTEKYENKTALAKAFGLEANIDTPIICMIARMVEQKGYDLVVDAADQIVELGAQLVILGEGTGKIPKALEKIAKKHKKNISVKIAYDEETAHLMQAGSDILLMPSKYEPCGLNQLYAMAYGTIPVVHETGGLIDSVEKFDPKKKSGTGFLFKNYTVADMMKSLKQAITLFKDSEEEWEELQRRGMEKDNSWKISADEYSSKIYS
ncbi:MAG: glycogen synthase GlgA [Ignavibacteriae bacterium]|nr:glycogen synthase GlgA [Ignavibacteriota bacterium]